MQNELITVLNKHLRRLMRLKGVETGLIFVSFDSARTCCVVIVVHSLPFLKINCKYRRYKAGITFLYSGCVQ